MNQRRVLVWLRRDLRLQDNTALARACADAADVVPVFVFDAGILGALQDGDDRRVTFIHRSLREVDAALKEQGSVLLVRHGDPADLIPQLAREVDADAVYTNRDYEPAAKRRDAHVAARLSDDGRQLTTFADQVVFEGSEVRTLDGNPYRVFTPYKRAWLRQYAEQSASGLHPLREEEADPRRFIDAGRIRHLLQPWELRDIGFTEADQVPAAGMAAARMSLDSFLARIDGYRDTRDFPAQDTTSRLSVHLRFGTISVRALFRAAMARSGPGAETWISELIWREFYQMILDQFPHVTDSAFKHEYNGIVWPGTDADFEVWKEGRTGFPLVDAAMRHFAATGWMHNRLRMVVAMFLTKDLLVDWRRGEQYFARYLLDFDLAANNGGWQWSASTGVDAQPYFRVFHPVLQSRKFDPDGEFIRKHVPELRGFSNTRIHWPHEADIFEQHSAGCILGRDYPHPVVDHAIQRERAIALFKQTPE